MADLTDYTEGEFRDWMSQGVAPDTAPDPVYVSLHTSDPGETPDGSTEVDSGTTSYARQTVAAGTGWNSITGGSGELGFENANDIEFPEATESWGTISHVALWTDAEGGANENAMASYSLDSTKSIDSGDQAVFRAGDLTFLLD